MQIKDVMAKEIKSILPDTNAKDALKVLIENDMSGLPVIDGSGRLVGVFTEREVLKAILPVYVRDVGAFIYAGESKAELKKLAGLEKFLVRNLMRKDVPTINADASLAEASKIMLTKSERRIVVIENGRPVGVITRGDVVRALAKQAGVEL